MQNNPFTSDTFKTLWLKHFHAGPSTALPGFLGIDFVKHPWLPLYYNTGKTLTKGITYALNSDEKADVSENVYMIYDVPDYLSINYDHDKAKHRSCLRITQYPGYLIDLKGYNHLDDFMQTNFSKSSRYKLYKYKKRLEASFDIHYRMYSGAMDKNHFLDLFGRFKALLEKRFNHKKERNNNLDTDEWQFYQDLAYPMLLEEKAGLFVVYQGQEPIAFTLNYFSRPILFDAITVFDIDYAKFHLGSVSIMGLIEWCLEHQFTTLDFSKGFFEYKQRWASREYRFEYHIYYDPRSARSRSLALVLSWYYRFKNALRQRNWNVWYHKLTYRMQPRAARIRKSLSFEFKELNSPPPYDGFQSIKLSQPGKVFLRPLVFEYLYLYPGHITEVQLWQNKKDPGYIIIEGPQKSVQVILQRAGDTTLS